MTQGQTPGTAGAGSIRRWRLGRKDRVIICPEMVYIYIYIYMVSRGQLDGT